MSTFERITDEIEAPIATGTADTSVNIDIFGDFGAAQARSLAEEAAPDLLAEWLAKRAEKGDKGDKGFGIKEMMVGRSDMFRVSLFDLNIEEGWNSRNLNSPRTRAHIEWLADNIAENGVKEALEVILRDGKLYIDDGHCRYYGAILAMKKHGVQIKNVKVVTVDRQKLGKIERLQTQILRNSSQRLSPMEMGVNFKKQINFGATEAEIAKALSLSVSYVQSILALQGADKATQELVNSGKVSATEAMKIVKAEGPDRAAEVLDAANKLAVEEGSEKVTRKHIDAVQGRRSHAKTVAELRKAINEPLPEGVPTKVISQALWDRMVELLGEP